MTRFRDLLKPDPHSSPKDEQERASLGLAEAVAGSRLRWWKARDAQACQRRCLLLAVAPYSQYDLTLLDLLDEHLGDGCPVCVTNVLDYATADALAPDFPGLGGSTQTPLLAVWNGGAVRAVAAGKKARDLLADALSLSPDELSLRVLTQAPSYLSAAEPG